MAKTLFKPVQYELSQLLGDIDLGKLGLPELQRPVGPSTRLTKAAALLIALPG